MNSRRSSPPRSGGGRRRFLAGTFGNSTTCVIDQTSFVGHQGSKSRACGGPRSRALVPLTTPPCPFAHDSFFLRRARKVDREEARHPSAPGRLSAPHHHAPPI